MSLKLERFNLADNTEVGLVNQWWSAKAGKPLSAAVRSDYGFMAYKDDSPVVAVFLYPTLGSRMAMIGFPVANPIIDKSTRREAISFLVAGVEQFAKELKYDFLVSYAGSKGAVELFERENYRVYDQNVTQFIKGL